MYAVAIKHDRCVDESGGLTGSSRISIGPFSRKAGVAELKKQQDYHRGWHARHSRHVLCIIRLEQET